MVGTNASINKKHNLYKSTVQAISIGGLDCTTKVGALCAHSVYMGAPFKTQVEHGLNKIFNFWVQTIDVSNQAVFTLKGLDIHDK